MHLKDASVALDVAFVPNVTVKHVGSRLIEVELAAAAARVENGGGGVKLGSFVILISLKVNALFLESVNDSVVENIGSDIVRKCSVIYVAAQRI